MLLASLAGAIFSTFSWSENRRAGQCLAKIVVLDSADLRAKLIEFRAWYNHARPHQHLAFRTPAEAWDGRERSQKSPWLLRVWDGELAGWFFPP